MLHTLFRTDKLLQTAHSDTFDTPPPPPPFTYPLLRTPSPPPYMHQGVGQATPGVHALHLLLGRNLNAYVDSHANSYENSKKKWTECTMDEWIAGADGIDFVSARFQTIDFSVLIFSSPRNLKEIC